MSASFEDGLNEMVVAGIIEEDEAVLLIEAEAFGEENSFELPTDAVIKTIEQIKEEYTMSQMRSLAKEAGLSGYSALRETELIEFLLENNVEL